MVQLKLAIGNVKNQKQALAAQNNITKTWEDLLNEAKVEDRNKELGWNELSEPTSPVVGLLLYIYQMENFVYSELNRSSRFKDTSKVKTLGPYALALGEIIDNA